MTAAAGIVTQTTGLPVSLVTEVATDPMEGPISFEPNQGQADQPVQFIARGPGYTLCLTHEAVLISFEALVGRTEASSQPVTIKLIGANSAAALIPKNQLPTKSSYFLGSDPRNWRTGIPTFAQVEFRDVYPGIDVGYHGTHGYLEYDFVVASGAAPSRIVLSLAGAGKPVLDAHGDVLLRTEQLEVRFRKPAAYQELEGSKRPVNARYTIRNRQIRVVVGAYDLSKPLVIDPVLSYAVLSKVRGGPDATPE